MKHYNFIVTIHTAGETTISDMKVVDAFAIEAATQDAAVEAAEEWAYNHHGADAQAYLSARDA